MKKSIFVSLLAVILVFYFTGCGASGLPVKFAFKNSDGSSRSVAQRSITAHSISSYNTDTASFKKYTDFYDNLGAPDYTFTPTEFTLFIQDIYMSGLDSFARLSPSMTAGGSNNINYVNSHLMANFTSPVVLQPGEVFPGKYTTLAFFFLTDKTTMKIETQNGDFFIPRDPRVTFKNSLDEEITMAPIELDPLPGMDILHGIVYTGSIYKAKHGNVKGSDLGISGVGLLSPYTAIFIPWSGITIPDSASAVRFEVHWDLKDIIEQYGDRYVFAKNFWERFSIVPIFE